MTDPTRRDSPMQADSPVADPPRLVPRPFSAALAAVLLSAAGTVDAVTCVRNIPPGNPNAAYLLHTDGTVTDARRHLMWKHCPEGRSGSACEVGFPIGMTVADALVAADASTFAGHDDWRLPNIPELLSLMEYCASDLTINADVFPNTSRTDISANATFWSSSYYSTTTSQAAWYANFLTGYSFTDPLDTQHFVRLVRDDFDSLFAGGFDL